VGGIGLTDPVVPVALVARVRVAAVRELTGRVLVVGLPDTGRARLADRETIVLPVE